MSIASGSNNIRKWKIYVYFVVQTLPEVPGLEHGTSCLRSRVDGLNLFLKRILLYCISMETVTIDLSPTGLGCISTWSDKDSTS